MATGMPRLSCLVALLPVLPYAHQNLLRQSTLAAGVKHHDAASADSAAFASIGKSFCERTVMMALKTCVMPFDDNTTYVVTGDIDAMWIRDSAAELNPYIDVALQEGPFSKLWPILEGAVRTSAKFITTDPYANSFTMSWDSERDKRLARGALVFTGNYELDDGPYFFRFLARLVQAKPDTELLREAPVHKAVKMLIALFRQEQQHANGESEYRYPKWEPFELPGSDGLGTPVAYTGLVWGAFRPSDDAQELGYNIPGNLFLASTLGPIERFAREAWNDARLASFISQLRADILEGVRRFGTKDLEDGRRVYCYEVDGLGGCKLMDDANVPSLLSLPYLDPTGQTYDKDIYRSTRQFLLSSQNNWYFSGRAGSGIGSPHTGEDRIWPMAVIMQAITAETAQERDEVKRQLTRQLQSMSQGFVESFDKDNLEDITRPWFGWPNSLFGEYMLSMDNCRPSTLGIIPEVKPAPKLPPLRSASKPMSFYNASVKLLRRKGVTLPKAKFF